MFPAASAMPSTVDTHKEIGDETLPIIIVIIILIIIVIIIIIIIIIILIQNLYIVNAYYM
jgi:hypothetical protein